MNVTNESNEFSQWEIRTLIPEPHKKVDFWRNSAGISAGISFFWKSPAGYLPSLWLDFRKLKSPQISGVRYTGRNHKRTRISEFQILISMGISLGLYFVYIVQLSLTSLLSGHVARCHFPDFCREIIWNHNLDIRTMRSFVISPCIPNTRYLPRFQLFCGERKP